MTATSPLSPAHDRGHDDPQSVASDSTVIHLRWQNIVDSKRSPDRLGMDEVRTYQLPLIAQKLSWSHINQVSCALRFFYGVTLGRPAHWRNAHANN
jgi:Phage integrase, N-terminal SAM-like domain